VASRADIQAFQKATRDVVTIVRAELTDFWAHVDTSSPEAARRQLDRFVPELVATYGQAAALVAANFYDELRTQARASGTFAATMAEPAPAEQVQGSNRWAVGPLVAGDAGQALANLLQVGERLVKQPARLTISQNIAADPGRPRWARVPTGTKTCAFCLMLASRGAVYATARSAGQMNRYHGDCDCVPTPMWDGEQFPDGYNPDALYEQYQAARAVAGGDPKAILAELRQREGIS
jgi:hypothetical protein